MSAPAEAAGPPAQKPSVVVPDPGLAGVSAATRVAGAVIALGYLTGLVPGSLVAAVLALGAVTFGRSLWSRERELLGVAAFGVVVVASVVGALRWGSDSLDAIRGAQAVLGPTVLIEPQEAAIGAGLAAGAGVLALSVWLGALRPAGLWSWVIVCAEGAVVALCLVTAFWGPAVIAPGAGDGAELARDLGGWALAVLAGLVPAVGLSWLWRRLHPVWSWVALVGAAAAALAGTILVPSFVT